MTRRSILVVEDETILAEFLSLVLREARYLTEAAGSGEEALRKLKEREYDGVITDIRMPGMSGIELYRRLETLYPHLAVRTLFATADSTSPEVSAFLRRSGRSVIPKPYDRRQILDAVARLLPQEPL